MKINISPVLTTRNYNINYLEVEDLEKKKDYITSNHVRFKNIKLDEYDIIEKPEIALKYGNSNDLRNEIKFVLKIDIKSKVFSKKYVVIDSKLSNASGIEINVKEDSKCCVYIVYKDLKYNNCTILTNLKKNAEAKVAVLNLTNKKAENYISIENTLEENAKLDYTIIDIGGNISSTNYYSNLKGDNSYNKLDSIYLGEKSQVKDLNYIGELFGKNTNMYIYAEGALKDSSKKHFKGTIDFKRGSKKAVGDESEYCTLLSDKAKSISLPMLLCEEEDVVGNHATAAGKIDKKQLFYLLSRGFDKAEAEKLIVRAKFNTVLEKLEDCSYYCEINKIIDEVL